MDIVKATEELIKLIDHTMGVVLEPTKTVLQAKADMKAERDRIRNKYKLDKIDIKERIKHRRFLTELRRQHNLEEIGYKALEFLPKNSEPQKISIDWINSYMTNAQDVGEEELRTLWAKILAGEANKPGKYSKRTLSYLQDFSLEDDVKNRFNVIPWDFMCLENISLLHGAAYSFKQDKPIVLGYFDKMIKILNRHNEKELIIEAFLITNVGMELSTIVEYEENKDYLDYLENYIKLNNLEIEIK
jgi:hypothetical protein